jgi:beta-phosphoglucomutase-like phosphatase (HAD superfamily)
MGPIQLVVFDMAGTTVEDKGVVLQSLVETAATYGLPGTPEELNALMGKSRFCG